MGSTLALVVVRDDRAVVGHIGDSRPTRAGRVAGQAQLDAAGGTLINIARSH